MTTSGTTQQTGQPTPPTTLIVWKADGTETASEVAIEWETPEGEVLTLRDVLARMGYTFWFDTGVGLMVHTRDTRRSRTRSAQAAYPFCVILWVGDTLRLVACETLHDVAAFTNDWLPILQAVSETKQEA
jgi:hypothetical protein